MCFHSACKATSVVQCFTGREERDCSRTAETRLSVTAVFRPVVPWSQPQRKPEHGPTTREEEKRSLLGCHSFIHTVMCSESGACYDHIAGENIQFMPLRLLLRWSWSISSSSTLVEMKISSQLSDWCLQGATRSPSGDPATFLQAPTRDSRKIKLLG